jgi:hypothetical protein
MMTSNRLPLVIAGLDPAIHPLRNDSCEGVMDARIKSGHDDRSLDTNILT